MAKTPEGEVKEKIKKVIAKYKPSVYTYWPVPNGYGRSSLDCLGCVNGKFFIIEAKRPDEFPTPKQEGVIEDVVNARGAVFVINSDATLFALDNWLSLRVEEIS